MIYIHIIQCSFKYKLQLLLVSDDLYTQYWAQFQVQVTTILADLNNIGHSSNFNLQLILDDLYNPECRF